MPRSSKSIIEQAIVDTARADYRHVTRGLSRTQKAKLVEYALRELQKLRSDRRLPDYRHTLVALFYTLWYLPRQVNLACRLVEEVFPLNEDVHIVDFGAGPGALSLGAAIAVARRRQTKIEPKITIHEVDCPAMQGLSNRIWLNYEQIATNDGNRGCQRAARAVEKRFYATADEVVSAYRADVPDDATSSLAALHVVYGDNQDAVKEALATLWEGTRPAWAFVTTQKVGSKLKFASNVVPFRQVPTAITTLPLHGQCAHVTGLRREIRSEFPYDWPQGKLLWPDVTWDFEEERPPYVLRCSGGFGGSP